MIFLHTVVTCPDIVDPIGGQVLFSNDTMAPFDIGTMAMYSCDDGSSPFGTVSPIVNPRVCTGDGSSSVGGWTGEDLMCNPNSRRYT